MNAAEALECRCGQGVDIASHPDAGQHCQSTEPTGDAI
jgi:hypothetical protein